MTSIEITVRDFAWQYLHDLQYRLGQMVPFADGKVGEVTAHITPDNILTATMEPQEWLTMARYGAGIQDADAGYIREICQAMAEWLFAPPGSAMYTIPDSWAETEMGALWWAALVRTEGDELITLGEAAQLSGTSIKTLSSRVDRGALKAYVDPNSPERQGRRLVRRSDVTG